MEEHDESAHLRSDSLYLLYHQRLVPEQLKQGIGLADEVQQNVDQSSYTGGCVQGKEVDVEGDVSYAIRISCKVLPTFLFCVPFEFLSSLPGRRTTEK